MPAGAAYVHPEVVICSAARTHPQNALALNPHSALETSRRRLAPTHQRGGRVQIGGSVVGPRAYRFHRWSRLRFGSWVSEAHNVGSIS